MLEILVKNIVEKLNFQCQEVKTESQVLSFLSPPWPDVFTTKKKIRRWISG